MKPLAKIFLIGFSAIAGLIFSLFVTMVAWNTQIERRAFHCTDDVGFGIFWEDITTHEHAGDTVSPGWTWDKLREAKAVYELAFVSIWFAGAFMVVRMVLPKARPEIHAHAT